MEKKGGAKCYASYFDHSYGGNPPPQINNISIADFKL